MEEHAGYGGRLLAGRYRLPAPPADSCDLAGSLAWDTASGQEVHVRQVPLPEVVEAEVVEDGHGSGAGGDGTRGAAGPYGTDVPYGRGAPYGPDGGRATRSPADLVVRRAMEAAVAAAQLPDHPRLDQVFDVFVEDGGLWIVSERVPGRPLSALLADRPLGAHRAAEIAADLLAALRIVHAHGWVHRNLTAHTVLICEDGRALLTGLAVGAAQEALCGYDPLPESAAPAGTGADTEPAPAPAT
ncbi:protein kinase, partial [Streptomyces albus subsp. chlorinus]|uniref:protein kinase n=1 Tax=Streptomyces albus TaxID=1888 RepID=UPI001D62C050|nr:protein kinase [Streptomyces albus subsp. chlorinus]